MTMHLFFRILCITKVFHQVWKFVFFFFFLLEILYQKDFLYFTTRNRTWKVYPFIEAVYFTWIYRTIQEIWDFESLFL